MNLFDATMIAMDRIIGDDPARVSTPLEHYETDDRPTFADLSPATQRYMVCEHIRKVPCDLGLIGESLNEHRRATDFVVAFKLGDTAEMGRLADLMIREYIGAVIDDE